MYSVSKLQGNMLKSVGQSRRQPTKEQTSNQLTQKIAETKQSISKFDFPSKICDDQKNK
jgi:hypothetical protein